MKRSAGRAELLAAPDPAWLAVDLARVESASGALAEWVAAARVRPPLRGELRLFESGAVPEVVRAELDARGALHPVLSQAGARLVVLPEVRVEAGAGTVESLRAMIERGSVPAAVEERPADGGTLLVLRPRSGRGADALVLAGALRGAPGVQAADPRLLRVVARPSA